MVLKRKSFFELNVWLRTSYKDNFHFNLHLLKILIKFYFFLATDIHLLFLFEMYW